MRRGTPYRIADNRQMRAEAQRTSSSPVSAESSAKSWAESWALPVRGLPRAFLIWLNQVFTAWAAHRRAEYPRTASRAFGDPASTRLGQFFGPAADERPGLSGFHLLSHGREAFIVRLALADLAERSLDMQYYVWDGDTTGRIIVDHVMKNWPNLNFTSGFAGFSTVPGDQTSCSFWRICPFGPVALSAWGPLSHFFACSGKSALRFSPASIV